MTDPLLMLVFVVAFAPVLIPVTMIVVGIWFVILGTLWRKVKRWWSKLRT